MEEKQKTPKWNFDNENRTPLHRPVLRGRRHLDVTMRMLRISEMKRIQGFGDDYVLVGTQEEQKKYLGNAVVTQVATALCEALAEALSEQTAGRVAS